MRVPEREKEREREKVCGSVYVVNQTIIGELEGNRDCDCVKTITASLPAVFRKLYVTGTKKRKKEMKIKK